MKPSIVARTPTIEGIQYLRGIAAMMVVFHHSRHVFGDVSGWSIFGSRGVDIFFVISGFVMAYTVRLTGTEWPQRMADMRTFLLKRFIRVAPLYWIALLVSAVFVYRLSLNNVQILKDVLFIPRLNTLEPQEIWPALVPGWTINYEMFFYLIFGLSILSGSRRLVLTSLVIAGFVLAGRVLGPFDAVPLRFYSAPIMLDFIAGLLLYPLWNYLVRIGSGGRWKYWLMLLAGFAMLIIGPSGGAPNAGFLTRLIPAFAIVLGAIFAFEKIHIPLLRLLGDASYSIYLFHLASFLVSWHVVTALGLSFTNLANPANVAAVLGVHLFIAAFAGILIHYFLEKPLIRVAGSLIDRLQTIRLARSSAKQAALKVQP